MLRGGWANANSMPEGRSWMWAETPKSDESYGWYDTSLCIKFRIMRILQGQSGISHCPPFLGMSMCFSCEWHSWFPEIASVRLPNFVLMTFGLNTWPQVSILWPFTDKLHVQEASESLTRVDIIKTEDAKAWFFFHSWGTPAADSFALACAVQLSSAQCQQQLQPQGWGSCWIWRFCKLKSEVRKECWIFASCPVVAPNKKNARRFFFWKKSKNIHLPVFISKRPLFTTPTVGVANALWAAARMTFLGPECAANLCIAAAEAVLEVPGKLKEFQPMELSMMLCLGVWFWWMAKKDGIFFFLALGGLFVLQWKKHKGVEF